MSLWAKIKALLHRAPKRPLVETTTFDHPSVGTINLGGVVMGPGATITRHTRAVITESVACAVGATPEHDIQIIIEDNVVKSIRSPCDRIVALTAAQLGEASCGQRYSEIVATLRGTRLALPWTQQWAEHNRRGGGRAIDSAVIRANQVRVARASLRAIPIIERTPTRVWEQLIRQTTGLSARVFVHEPQGQFVHIYVETPGVESIYNLIGDMWALGQGPGDQRVYELLNKYVKLVGKLVGR